MNDLDKAIEQLGDAVAKDDADAGRLAVMALARIVLGDVRRIADALDDIARNLPTK